MRTPFVIEMTNSNSDDFAHNKTMLRAEERISLGVVRPTAINVITLT